MAGKILLAIFIKVENKDCELESSNTSLALIADSLSLSSATGWTNTVADGYHALLDISECSLVDVNDKPAGIFQPR